MQEQDITAQEVKADLAALDAEDSERATIDLAQYEGRVYSIDDILGSEDDPVDIHFRPDGVPEEVPEHLLPGVRLKKIDDETLTKYREIYAGKPGKKNSGNPRRAQLFLFRNKFDRMLNTQLPNGFEGTELDFLLTTPRGRLIVSYVLPIYIDREIPDTAEGNE